MKLLDRVVESTTEYIETMPKTLRKKYGQFFTSKETAVFMAGLFNILEGCIEISVLDPGAGSGITLYCSFGEVRYSFSKES